MITRFSILKVQLKAGNNSLKLKNEDNCCNHYTDQIKKNL